MKKACKTQKLTKTAAELCMNVGFMKKREYDNTLFKLSGKDKALSSHLQAPGLYSSEIMQHNVEIQSDVSAGGIL